MTKPNLSPDDVLIRMWKTPNPYALKFTFNVPLKEQGKASFYCAEECEHLPLAHSLFSIRGVKMIYFFQNQLTVTHNGELSEQEIEDQVTAVIRTRIAVHDPSFMEENSLDSKKNLSAKSKSQDPLIQKIDSILDRTVRPGLQADGGDLEVISASSDEIQIAYQGACGGCPSAITGTLTAIENILRHELKNPSLNVTPV